MQKNFLLGFLSLLLVSTSESSKFSTREAPPEWRTRSLDLQHQHQQQQQHFIYANTLA